jgi:membrane protease YdiL (CAAX protease family)
MTTSANRTPSRATLLFAALWPTVGTWLYFFAFADPRWMQLSYLLAKGVQVALIVWAGFALRSAARQKLLPSLLPGLASGVLVGGGLLAVYRWHFAGQPLLAAAPGLLRAKLEAFGIESAFGFLLLAVFYSLVHSLFEELYWRRLVYGGLRRHLPVGAATVLGGLAFASHHVLLLVGYLNGFTLFSVIGGLSVAGVGMLWSWLYERSGRLAGAWVSHVLVDAALMWIGFQLWSAG